VLSGRRSLPGLSSRSGRSSRSNRSTVVVVLVVLYLVLVVVKVVLAVLTAPPRQDDLPNPRRQEDQHLPAPAPALSGHVPCLQL
jgi:hypothetical protein